MGEVPNEDRVIILIPNAITNNETPKTKYRRNNSNLLFTGLSIEYFSFDFDDAKMFHYLYS